MKLAGDAVRRYLQQRKSADTFQPNPTEAKRTLLDLFEPIRGLDVEFARNPSTGRPVDL